MENIAPERIAAAEQPAKACLENVSRILNSSDWKKSKKEDGVEYFTRKVKGSNFKMIKSTTIVPRPLDDMITFSSRFREVTPDMPAEIRTGSIERRLFKFPEPNPHNDGFVYLAIESGTKIVSDRDFVMIRKYFQKDGIHYYICVSIDDDQVRPVSKNLVRAKMLCNAIVLEPSGQNTKVSFICHADPAGAIPSKVYNMVSLKQGVCVKDIRDCAILEI
ncbi:PCTP-like protein [Histomonas meleagridis]|uniref:PCTP-like protein n=1 Tax=Histomonas meleagridis TaxID=135588 RepID=UPI00355969F8|nr:PCTP-like protein [Histomonas meleagridis]KAH0802850.1 PCTP-like protein [Histomonas meleagridis]